MLNFEEELKRFSLSEEVDTEAAKADTEQVTDVSDILVELLKELKEK